MIDHRLRAAKDRAVEPVTSRLPDLVTPGRLTAASVVAGVVAGVLGGCLDLMGDTVGYAAVPLGVAAAHGDARVWAACAVLLASFYLNTMSWTLLSAIAEKRRVGAGTRGEQTTIHMPAGLIEGAETIVLFSLMLALPDQALASFWVMAMLVAVTILQRVGWASRTVPSENSRRMTIVATRGAGCGSQDGRRACSSPLAAGLVSLRPGRVIATTNATTASQNATTKIRL